MEMYRSDISVGSSPLCRSWLLLFECTTAYAESSIIFAFFPKKDFPFSPLFHFAETVLQYGM